MVVLDCLVQWTPTRSNYAVAFERDAIIGEKAVDTMRRKGDRAILQSQVVPWARVLLPCLCDGRYVYSLHDSMRIRSATHSIFYIPYPIPYTLYSTLLNPS